jgi:hypothetical protein
MSKLNNIYDSFESSPLPETNLTKSDKRYKGKTVVLVDSENPWYQNDTTVPMKYKTTELFYEDKNIYKQNLYVPYGRAQSCVKYDLCKSNLGLGYSQLDRDIQTKKLCGNVENFNTSSSTYDATDKMNRNILILIFIILIGIIIYKKYKS